MVEISYETTQFALIILTVICMYFLFMGYFLPGEKGGWFLIFGGFFEISLTLMLFSTFETIWFFCSPGIALFGILNIRDGILKTFFKANI